MEKMIKTGVGVIITKDDKILLGKRSEDHEKADSELHGEGTWTCPGGKMEFGEKIVECARREVQEETGIKINEVKLISITNDRFKDSQFITVGFLCEDFNGEPKTMEPDEITEWGWFPLNELPKPLFFPSEKLVNNYLSKNIYKGD